jgi:hypothetical protein
VEKMWAIPTVVGLCPDAPELASSETFPSFTFIDEPQCSGVRCNFRSLKGLEVPLGSVLSIHLDKVGSRRSQEDCFSEEKPDPDRASRRMWITEAVGR